MKHFSRTFVRIVLSGLLMLFGTSLPLMAQISVTKHKVGSGVTLFKLDPHYGVSVQRILEYNRGLDADHIQSGQIIVIPSGIIPEAQPVKPLPAKPVVQYKDYKVKRKDTPYALAKANGITVDELMEANPQLKEDGYKLKKGMVIKIPVKVYPKSPRYVGISTVRLAVVLPLVGNKMENLRSVEFYRGMLMGVEALRERGVNVEVHAFQEPSSARSVAQLMDTVRAMHPDVIVGPVYPSHFSDVSACANAKTRVVVPFSSKVPQVEFQSNLFVVNTPADFEQTLAMDLVLSVFKKSDRFVFVQSSKGGKSAFCQSMMARLNSAGYEVVGVPAHSSAAAVAELLRPKGKGHFILLPDDAGEEQMASSLAMVKEMQKLLPESSFSLLGYDHWIQFADGNYRKDFHVADTYVLSTSYFYPYTADAIRFGNDYERWFKTKLLSCMPRMAPLGYDVAISMLGGLATYGYDFNTQTPAEGTVASIPRLQSDLRFMKATSNGGYVSRSMWLVHFMPNNSIVKLSAK